MLRKSTFFCACRHPSAESEISKSIHFASIKAFSLSSVYWSLFGGIGILFQTIFSHASNFSSFDILSSFFTLGQPNSVVTSYTLRSSPSFMLLYIALAFSSRAIAHRCQVFTIVNCFFSIGMSSIFSANEKIIIGQMAAPRCHKFLAICLSCVCLELSW